MVFKLKQLVSGNPGTSFVVALLYVLNKKFHVVVKNDDQLLIFKEGMVKSRKVFFSGVLKEIGLKYKRRVSFLTNSKFLLRLAEGEVDKKLVRMEYNQLSLDKVRELVEKYEFVVLSVDLYLFNNYHDYHFVTIFRENDGYRVFEPKNGEIKKLNADEFSRLVASVSEGLKDVMMVFCL